MLLTLFGVTRLKKLYGFLLVIVMGSGLLTGCAIQTPQLKDIIGEWEASSLVHSRLMINKNGTGLIGLYLDDAYVCPITKIEFGEPDIELFLDCSALDPENDYSKVQKLVVQATGDAMYLMDIVGHDEAFNDPKAQEDEKDMLGTLVYLRASELQLMRELLKQRMREY